MTSERSRTPTAIPSLTLPNFIRAAGMCDIQIAPLLRAVGWDPETMQVGRDLISVEALDRLMLLCTDEAKRRSADQHFPLVLGEIFGFHALYELEVFFAACPTARHGVRAFEWFSRFVHPKLTVRFEEGPDVSCFVLLEEADPAIYRNLIEATLASMARIGRTMFGGATRANEVHLAFDAPPYARLYDPVLRAPTLFGQPRTAVYIDTAALDEPLPGSMQAMHAQAEATLCQQMAQLPQEGRFATKLERAFDDCPELLALSIDAMADRLAMSRRTLQRRLSDEGCSYTEIQNKVRLRWAKQHLLSGKLSIDSVAERLGFADRQGFTLAFSRWTGMTPAEFRRAKGF